MDICLKLVVSCFFGGMVFFANFSASEIYREIDKNGKIKFSDKKTPGSEQEAVTMKVQASTWKQFEIKIIDDSALLTKAEVERISRDVNVVYQFYDQKLYFDIYKTVPVKIRLFKDHADYMQHLSLLKYSPKSTERGVYFPKSNEIFLWLNPVRWRTFWTIKHEVSHAIVDTLIPYAPTWLNEGLAENMEAIAYKNDSFYLVQHDENFNWLKKNSNNDNIRNVEKFLSESSSSWRKRSSNAHAGEFVRMLLSTKAGKSFIVELIHQFERGDRTLSHIHAKKLYIGGLVVMQDDWNRWRNRAKSVKFWL